DNGGVTRGICTVTDDALVGIDETKEIVKNGTDARSGDLALSGDALVSMNFWCFPSDFIDVLKKGFPEYLSGMNNPLKDEYLLPIIVDGMLKEGGKVTVLPSQDKWFGVTYQEDKPAVIESFKKLREEGVYQADLYADL
ncbi:MAG: nucleotidyltransferase, partial [Blautia sp.]|nr:nucleotidyltransferase [Blautia sp.]